MDIARRIYYNVYQLRVRLYPMTKYSPTNLSPDHYLGPGDMLFCVNCVMFERQRYLEQQRKNT